MLRPSNGENPVKPGKNEKYVTKTCTFYVIRCDEIFDLLVADGQVIVPKGLKTPPLKQRKKKRFCKFHNFLGHKTSQCILFRDLVQNALKEQEEENSYSKVEEALYVESVDVMMVDIMDYRNTEVVEVSSLDYTE